jgi:hypothetical protein
MKKKQESVALATVPSIGVQPSTQAKQRVKGRHKVEIQILDLRVLIVPEGGQWVAQGLEIDYVAYGATVNEAKANFENGLAATLQHNMEAFGTIENVLKVAPEDVWSEFWRTAPGSRNQYSQISVHHLSKAQKRAAEANVDQRGIASVPFPEFGQIKISSYIGPMAA